MEPTASVSLNCREGFFPETSVLAYAAPCMSTQPVIGASVPMRHALVQSYPLHADVRESVAHRDIKRSSREVFTGTVH